jgi:cyclopropane fatty-acyl-phospholipid synthase-like methyltransferase
MDMEINEYERQLSREEIDQGVHRGFVGGMWDEIGKLQFKFLVEQGLRQDMRLLDIGCGALRGGIHFVRYLNRGNYFGVDMNESLIMAGYEKELVAAGLVEKLPRSNLMVDRHFRFKKLDIEFDMALALSVLTHLQLNSIHLCLIELSKCMKKDGRLYATFFECPKDHPLEQPLRHEPGGVVTYFDRDPYHYRISHLLMIINDLPWTLEYIGNWDHPRAQKMVSFMRR